MVFNTKEIVKEWSHRVSSGMPDKNNTWHVDKLKKLLIEKKYPKQFINEYIRVLINDLPEVKQLFIDYTEGKFDEE